MFFVSFEHFTTSFGLGINLMEGNIQRREGGTKNHILRLLYGVVDQYTSTHHREGTAERGVLLLDALDGLVNIVLLCLNANDMQWISTSKNLCINTEEEHVLL